MLSATLLEPERTLSERDMSEASRKTQLMTKKTASKTSAKPAARASRSAAAHATSNGRTAAAEATTAKANPTKLAAAPKVAVKKPGARAGVKSVETQAEAAPSPEVQATAPETPVVLSDQHAEPEAPQNDTAAGMDSPKSSGAAELAERLVDTNDSAAVGTHAEHLMSDKPTVATASARILEEVLTRKPDMLVPVIDKLVHVVTIGPKRSVQMAAAALPVMARLAPARVARHLPMLTERFAQSSDHGKDGLVSTFAALCTASVAYQKRLEPVLELALSTAEPKTLHRWTEIVLPSLKGEPHAHARAVVEERLNHIPRPLAQPIATFLGIKLRPAAR